MSTSPRPARSTSTASSSRPGSSTSTPTTTHRCSGIHCARRRRCTASPRSSGGNCGFTIAPLGSDDDVDYVMRMMARVEGMSIDALRAGPSWDWRTFGEWLDRLDGRLGVNAGFLVGHSTIRRCVMGDAATRDAGHAGQVAAMVELAHEAMTSGALGVSVVVRRGAHRRRRQPRAVTGRRTRRAPRARARRSRPRGHDPRVHPCSRRRSAPIASS